MSTILILDSVKEWKHETTDAWGKCKEPGLVKREGSRGMEPQSSKKAIDWEMGRANVW